jgi:hypothetical protein
MRPGGPHHLIEVDVHGAAVLTAGTEGANPRKTRINEFLIQTQQCHAHCLTHVHTVNPCNWAAAGTGAAGEAEIGKFSRQPPLFSFIQNERFRLH